MVRNVSDQQSRKSTKNHRKFAQSVGQFSPVKEQRRATYTVLNNLLSTDFAHTDH